MKATSLFFGMAVGFCVGYYLATEDKEELVSNVKDSANRAKDFVENGINKGKKLVDEMRSRSQEV